MSVLEPFRSGTSEEASLLHSATTDAPSSAARDQARRVLDNLLAGPTASDPHDASANHAEPPTTPPAIRPSAVTPPTTAPLATAASHASSMPIAIMGAFLAGLVGMTAIGVGALRPHELQAITTASVSTPVATGERVATASTIAIAAIMTAAATDSPSAPPTTKTVDPSAPATLLHERNSATATVPTPSSLADEVASIDQVRRAIAGGDFAQAQQGLDGYAKRFPRGELRDTASVLRIDLNVHSGRIAEAQVLARSFVRNHPQSPFLGKVRALVPAADIPGKDR